MIIIPDSPIAVTHLKRPIILPGTPLPDYVVEKILASEQVIDDDDSSFETMFSGAKPIDSSGFTGAVTQWVEGELGSLGYPINHSRGIDVPPYSIEIRTRRKHATAPQTFGSLKLSDIIQNSWLTSDIKTKCQLHYQVMWDAQHMVVCDDQIVDFRHPWRQEALQKAFDNARDELIAYYSRPNITVPLKFTSTAGGIYLERTSRKNSKKSWFSAFYQFRVRNNLMEKWHIAGRKNSYDELFSKI
jgi:hypothetical protein